MANYSCLVRFVMEICYAYVCYTDFSLISLLRIMWYKRRRHVLQIYIAYIYPYISNMNFLYKGKMSAVSRALLAAAVPQRLVAQNNLCAKEAYFLVTYSGNSPSAL